MVRVRVIVTVIVIVIAIVSDAVGAVGSQRVWPEVCGCFDGARPDYFINNLARLD